MFGIANGPVEQVAAAIRALFVQPVGAVGAKGALKGTDERAVHLRGQIDAAFFAIGPHFKH
jgi:hypothetical protein